MNFNRKKCIPCEGGILPLKIIQVKEYIKEIPNWKITEDKKKIMREFKFKNFKEAMVFVNKVAELSEKENHHPDFYISYNKVILELWTHKINGLSENDFILASKIDKIL